MAGCVQSEAPQVGPAGHTATLRLQVPIPTPGPSCWTCLLEPSGVFPLALHQKPLAPCTPTPDKGTKLIQTRGFTKTAACVCGRTGCMLALNIHFSPLTQLLKYLTPPATRPGLFMKLNRAPGLTANLPTKLHKNVLKALHKYVEECKELIRLVGSQAL